MLENVTILERFGRFGANLKWMGIGMLGVFMIVGIIMGATYLIGYLTNKFDNKGE